MSTTATTPCRVPPPGDAGADPSLAWTGAVAARRPVEGLTLGDKVVRDHRLGRPHLAPLCRLCADAPD